MIERSKLVKPSPYANSQLKRLFDLCVSILFLIVSSPLLIFLALIIKYKSGSPSFFMQKRVGKNRDIFLLVKFRTMKNNAEKLLSKYKHLNEADGPVFKIRNDPRYTDIGRVLAKTGLDELPQLINVIRGDMSLVGPRPLPVHEASSIEKKYQIRHEVKPGITSLWVIRGAHNLTFEKWMQLDKKYINEASLVVDIKILIKTGLNIGRYIINEAV